MVLKESPASEDSAEFNVFGRRASNVQNTDQVSCKISGLTQHADVNVEKILYTGEKTSQLFLLGQSAGRCVELWRRANYTDESLEAFDILMRKPVDIDPNDACRISENMICVGFIDGSLSIYNTNEESIILAKKIESVHEGSESRVLCAYENGVLSGSTNGSLEYVDAETGAATTIFAGHSGIRSMCVVPGGHIVFTGNATGQIALWDVRQANSTGSRAAKEILTPSNKLLDAVTALCNHPAQSNVLCCGTDDGLIGFVDIRGNDSDSVVVDARTLTRRGITQVSFHSTSPDNLFVSSKDGSLLRLDASAVPVTTRGGARINAWLQADNLAGGVRVDQLRSPGFSPVTSFAVRHNSVVASTAIGMIHVYEDLPFLPSKNTGF